MTTVVHSYQNLVEGRWYALLTQDNGRDFWGAPVAQYCGEGLFMDDDDHEYSFHDYDEFVEN